MEEKKEQELKQELLDLEEKINSAYWQLGKLISEVSFEKNIEINDLMDEVVKKKRQLVKSLNKHYCPYCFHENPNEIELCEYCKMPLERED